MKITMLWQAISWPRLAHLEASRGRAQAGAGPATHPDAAQQPLGLLIELGALGRCPFVSHRRAQDLPAST